MKKTQKQLNKEIEKIEQGLKGNQSILEDTKEIIKKLRETRKNNPEKIKEILNYIKGK